MKIHVYADAYGLWHAVVPTVGSVKAQRERARRAIAQEVRIRQGDQRPRIRLADTPSVTPRTDVREWREAA
jgi:hypothetical protein